MLLRKLIILTFITLLLSACAEISMEEEDKIIVDAFHIMDYIKGSKWEELSEHVHEDVGLLFSLYANVYENDVVFSKEQVAHIEKDTEVYNFGHHFATDHTYEMTAKEFIQEVLLRHEIGINKGQEIEYSDTAFNTSQVKSAGIINNIHEVYPEAFYVEFYSPSTGEMVEEDWQALRFVFQKERRHWYLVAIVRDVHSP
ncbi:hypothetical protein [Bacillus alkalisoli]|uniref:hypothetical protein n=1 Tax=Bacillus alkalisoli TaxID=2011008 RepID=UPI000C248E2F|nr:hypothetical protein [Bacillus alkalisoli]